MRGNTIKQLCPWLSQFTAVAALILIAFVRGQYAFVFGNTAGMLLLAATIAAVLTLILGMVSLPRWQGFVAVAAFCFVAYCLLFVRMYVIACN